MQIAATFETRKGNSNDGKIVAVFTDNLGTSATPFTIGLGVTDPVGNLISDYNVNVAALSIGGTNTLTVDIPLDSSGNYLSGEYQLAFSYYNIGPTESDVVETGYVYTPKHIPDHTESDLITLETTLDCDAETLLAKDTSEYGDVDRLTRLITITPPEISGESPETTTSAQVSAAVTYTNVTYSSLLEVSFEYDELEVSSDVGVISRGSAAIYIEDAVDCDPNICQVVKCLASKFSALKAKAAKVGGWGGLSDQDRGDFEYASTLVSLAQQLRACGEYAAAKPYVDEAKTILNCDCGCAENTKPTPL